MKHTQGPWIYQESTKTIRSKKENYWLATMDSWDGAVNHTANARLIAAAPEMYEALKILVSQYEDSGDFTMGGRLTNDGFLKGKTALKKAEGEK